MTTLSPVDVDVLRAAEANRGYIRHDDLRGPRRKAADRLVRRDMLSFGAPAAGGHHITARGRQALAELEARER